MTATTETSLHVGVQMPSDWIPGAWTIDPAHTTVSFSVRHLMSRVHGTFSEVSGQISTSNEPSFSTANAVIAVSSVNTGNEMRDNHLRSADFFDAERFPSMTFASIALRRVAESWVLAGDLTIRGITRPVDLEVEFLGTDPAGLQGEPRIGFSARGTIHRRDYGITFGLAADGARIIVGDQVDIMLDVQAYQQGI
jgi:polyisoprenoid-binding protein YceI